MQEAVCLCMLSQVLSVLVQYNCTAPRIACAVLNKVGTVQSSFAHDPALSQRWCNTALQHTLATQCTALPHIATLPSGVPNSCATPSHAHAACQTITLASELAEQLPTTTLGGRVASNV